MMEFVIVLIMIIWIISALSTEYHSCRVQRFSEMAPRLPEIDHLIGAYRAINGNPELRESDSVSS